MNEHEYMSHDAMGLAELIRSGAISAREVRDAAMRVIERRNPDLNAVIRLHDRPEGEALPQGRNGAFAGVPFLLKDANLYSHDMPTSFGSAFFRDAKPKPDSCMVERWRKAGLVMLGKTNTPEFAAEFVTEPRAFGPTHNPAAPGLTVGGSSGGAAAAVASGMVPMAHATDLGGSIRIPAGCCGVFGFKPTSGLNPVAPHFEAIAGGLNSDHVLTRSVRDSAASLDITADRRPGGGSYLGALREPTGRLRIGVTWHEPAGSPAAADQQQAVSEAAQTLEGLGHEIVDYRYPQHLSADWFDYLWIFDIVDLVEEHARESGREPAEDELELLTWHLLDKARRAGRQAHSEAQVARAAYNERYFGSMRDLDVILTPTLASNPPVTGALAFSRFKDVDRWNDAGYAFAPFSIPSNISGQPSASCPWLKSVSGLSVGIQISGKPGADLLVLQLCAQLEAALKGSGTV
jgi:amidase